MTRPQKIPLVVLSVAAHCWIAHAGEKTYQATKSIELTAGAAGAEEEETQGGESRAVRLV